jgi:hypothetical protein
MTFKHPIVSMVNENLNNKRESMDEMLFVENVNNKRGSMDEMLFVGDIQSVMFDLLSE